MDEGRKKLSKSDVRKAYWVWTWFSHACYNYERLQAMSFAQSMGVILKKLYPNKEELGREMQKHTAFFNTEPNTGGVIHGVVIAMEEQRANGEPVSAEVINGLKTGLMGPFAGIGDTLIQGIIVPVLLAIAIGIAEGGNPMGPVFYFVGIAVSALGIGYMSWMYGYKMGTAAIEKVLAGGLINKLLKAAGVLGCLVLGGLVSSFVNITTPISLTTSTGTFSLQTDLFDKLVPGLLSIGMTMVVFALVKKGVKSNRLILYLFVIGVVGSLLGILG